MNDPLSTPEGALAPESVVRLDVDGVTAAIWHCTPVDLHTLVVGWLVSEGIASGLVDVHHIDVVETGPVGPVVELTLAGEADARLWRAVGSERSSGASPAGPGPGSGSARPSPRRVDPDVQRLLEEGERVGALFRDMFEAATLRSSVGGVHTGGLVREGELVSVVEDVSRHHVVDRLVGRSVLDGAGPTGAVLLLSSRISGTMAYKACRAEVAALVSRSIPSELAAAVATRCGLVLVGRARGENRHIHWPA